MKFRIKARLFQLLSLSSVFALMSFDKEQVISAETLLKEMVDTKSITYFPAQYYTTKQFSSYDRASDKGDKNHFTWFANGDSSQFIDRDTLSDGRIENVMYDAAGPGSVTRFWITVAGAGVSDGIIRVYIDGNAEPVLEGSALDLIGSNALVGYPLSASVSELTPKLNRGHNFYMPIPYAKSCKITYENALMNSGKEGYHAFYYNVNYRTYGENTIVESFTKNTLSSLQSLIKETNAALLSPAVLADKIGKEVSISLEPKANKTITIKKKRSALSEIEIKLKANDMEQALRSTIIKISFDDNQTVWAPLGDFFATGHAWCDSKTWRTEVDSSSSTLSSNWIMPFKKVCEITFENLGNQDVNLEANVTQCDYKWCDESSMYFGASWHQYTSISTGKDKHNMNGDNEGSIDVNFINLEGRGVYVGDALSIYNTAPASWRAWWGEGDEKIYVDGETFPSHFGTGTEDYYGYAWCRPEVFNHPFIAQPIGDGDLAPGYTVNSRFRGLDAIPFKSSLEFDMELWHWSGVKINYAPTTFYYMLPGGTTDRVADEVGAKVKVARSIEDVLNN